MGCPPVRKIIHSLKLVDYLHVQADNPWYNYYLTLLNGVVHDSQRLLSHLLVNFVRIYRKDESAPSGTV